MRMSGPRALNVCGFTSPGGFEAPVFVCDSALTGHIFNKLRSSPHRQSSAHSCAVAEWLSMFMCVCVCVYVRMRVSVRFSPIHAPIRLMTNVYFVALFSFLLSATVLSVVFCFQKILLPLHMLPSCFLFLLTPSPQPTATKPYIHPILHFLLHIFCFVSPFLFFPFTLTKYPPSIYTSISFLPFGRPFFFLGLRKYSSSRPHPLIHGGDFSRSLHSSLHQEGEGERL